MDSPFSIRKEYMVYNGKHNSGKEKNDATARHTIQWKREK